MKHNQKVREELQVYKAECYGQYKRNDKLCWNSCVLRLSCAIELNRIKHIEIIEDLIGNDGVIIKI